MKQETVDGMARTLIMAGGATTAWTLQDISFMSAILAAVVTAAYGIVQMVFLLRKWYKLEKSNWKAKVTDHGDFDDKRGKDR